MKPGVTEVLSTDDIKKILDLEVDDDEVARIIAKVCLSHQQMKTHISLGAQFFTAPIGPDKYEEFARWMSETNFVVR